MQCTTLHVPFPGEHWGKEGSRCTSTGAYVRTATGNSAVVLLENTAQLRHYQTPRGHHGATYLQGLFTSRNFCLPCKITHNCDTHNSHPYRDTLTSSLDTEKLLSLRDFFPPPLSDAVNSNKMDWIKVFSTKLVKHYSNVQGRIKMLEKYYSVVCCGFFLFLKGPFSVGLYFYHEYICHGLFNF